MPPNTTFIPRVLFIFTICALCLLVYLLSPSSGSAHQTPITMPETKLRVPYRKAEGLPIPTDIYLPSPQDLKHKLAPVLIMVHGGAWIVGHSGTMNLDQIEDCSLRGWIVLSIEHRLCPGVDVLEGPMSDTREALRWVQTGGLGEVLKSRGSRVKPDGERVLVMGASSGGHLALSTGFDVPKPPLVILDFFGVKHFDDPFWEGSIDVLRNNHSRFDTYYQPLFEERHVYTGGQSLEGSHGGPSTPATSDRRQKIVRQLVGESALLKAVVPSSGKLEDVDPAMNLGPDFPPTVVVHGTEDWLLPIGLSRRFKARLDEAGVEAEFVEVEGANHAFMGDMKKDSRMWKTQRRAFDWAERILERSYG